MNNIDSFIARGMHKTKNSKILNKTWNDFSAECSNKQLVLYGISDILRFLCMRCDKKFSIIAAIDNDVLKQGHSLSEFFDSNDLDTTKKITISSRESLKNYDPNNVVVLISSPRYYEEIAEELESNGFHNYFSTLNLEYYYRQEHTEINKSDYIDDFNMNDYAKECAAKYPIQNNKIVFHK